MGSARDLADLAANASTIPLTATPAILYDAITNGGMAVDQHSVEVRTGMGDQTIKFLADLWELWPGSSPSARWTGSNEDGGGVDGNSPWIKVLNTTADASPGTDEAQTLMHKIEARNCLPMLDSSGDLEAHVLAFDVIAHIDGASSITFPATGAVMLTGQDGQRQFVTEVTITAADTWQRVEAVIAADSVFTVANDNGEGVRLGLNLYGGSGRNTTADTWATNANDHNTAASENWADATNNYIGMTNVTMVKGTTAQDYQFEDYAITLQKCYRYYYHFNLLGGLRLTGGVYDATNTQGIRNPFPTEMRADPTESHTDSVFKAAAKGTSHDTTIALNIGTDQWGFQANISTGMTAGTQGEVMYIIDNSGTTDTGDIKFTAEL